MDIQMLFIKLDVELRSVYRNSFNIDLFSMPSAESSARLDLPDSLVKFYREYESLIYKWETVELLDESGWKLDGSINIVKAENILKKPEIEFHDNDSEQLKKYRAVDRFVAEATAGILLDGKKSDEMYFSITGENDVESMNVDFNGYLELMFMARGFMYWQAAVLNIKNGTGYGGETKRFKTYMPQLFPDFKWEEFVALYEKVKIK